MSPLWLLMSFVVVVLASADYDHASLPVLRAARKRSDLAKRALTLETTTAAAFRYIDAPRDEGQTFYSDVHVEAVEPMLILEEFDHLFHRIDCSDTTLTIHFSDRDSFDPASSLAATLSGGLVATAHDECSDGTARSLRRVSEVHLDDDAMQISFHGSVADWHTSFKSMRISHGHAWDEPHIQLSRRQVDDGRDVNDGSGSYTDGNTASNGSTFLDFSQATPKIDTTFPLISELTGLPVSFGCKNCTITGSMNITDSNFDIVDIAKKTREFFSGNHSEASSNQTSGMNDLDALGAADFTLDLVGFLAHIDLWASPAQKGSISLPVFQYIPFGFKIPDIGKLGFEVVSELVLDWAIAGGLRMSYGFEVAIPDSRLHIDLKDFTRSRATGFQNATIKALPFQADIADLGLELLFTFRPRISAVMEFGEILDAEAGVFIDTPTLNITVSQISSNEYDSDCRPRSSDTQLSEAERDVLAEYTNLTHIIGTSQVGLGADVDLDFDFKKAQRQVAATASILSTTDQIATTCLVWREAPSAPPVVYGTSTVLGPTATFVAASEVVAETSSAIAAASASASVTGGAPRAVVVGRWTGMSAVAAVVAVAAAMVML